MSKTSPPHTSPPRRSSITFNEKEEAQKDPKKDGAAFADLEEEAPGTNKIPSKTSQESAKKTASPTASTPSEGQRRKSDPPDVSAIQAPGSPPKQKPSVDSAPPKQPSDKYVPSPYVFRAPTRVKQLRRILAKCPPFYIQLDHTLAVIWILFSDDTDQPLGIAQLQWALNFLQGIYTRKGEHPKDVGLCIQAIEDLLMDKYADMVDEVTMIEEEEKKKRRQKMMYLSSEQSLRSKASVCESDTCFGKLSLDVDKEIVEEAELLIKQVPFSVNYSEMTDKAGTDVKQLYYKQSKDSTEASGLDLDIPQENTMDFLRQWRRDQISKIQAELKRLHSIEAYIGCTETNFDNMKDPRPDPTDTRDRPERERYY